MQGFKTINIISGKQTPQVWKQTRTELDEEQSNSVKENNDTNNRDCDLWSINVLIQQIINLYLEVLNKSIYC